MTNVKVTVTKEVAEAIEVVKAKYGIYEALVQVEGAIYSEPEMTIKRWVTVSDGMTYDILAEILVNGYTVEKSPEEKVREYFASYSIGATSRVAIIETLNILGVKVGGVNACLKD